MKDPPNVLHLAGPSVNGKKAMALKRGKLFERIKTLKGKSHECLTLKNRSQVLGEGNR
jgi:hypothetical protein